MWTRDTIRAEQLRGVLNYDPETGEFRWINAAKGHFANAIAGNLRPDGYNKSTGVKGVYYRDDCPSTPWIAAIAPHGRLHVLGMFRTLEEAKAARSAAAQAFFGEFSRDE